MITYVKEEPVLQLHGVGQVLGGRTILRDITTDILNITRPGCEQGQIICVLGPSGVGKTVLARILAGLAQPSSGDVLIRGGVPVRKGLVGMVPQDYPLFEFETVQGNLLIAGRQGGLDLPAAVAKYTTLLRQFDLLKYLHYYPAQLSGGTRQRVAIVRQLMCSEHYLIMDEPFSGLDLIMKARACELIQRVANLHSLNTIIVNTHDVTEGMSIADTVWLMGLEHDAAGAFIPGARIVETYDLAALGLAWRPGIQDDPEFQSLVRQVKARFKELVQ